MKTLATAIALTAALAAPASAQAPKQTPTVHHEPCWTMCVRHLTLKPGVKTSWTTRPSFRVDREQALGMYLGKRERKNERSRLGPGDLVGCTYYAQAAGVLVRVDALGCKTQRRTRLRFTLTSLRDHTTHWRLTLLDRPYPEPVPEFEDQPTEYDQWGRPDDSNCYGVDPALPLANCPLP